MSFEEYDALELAKDLQANRELGRNEFSEPLLEDSSGGMSRRDLLVRGGVGAAAKANVIHARPTTVCVHPSLD